MPREQQLTACPHHNIIRETPNRKSAGKMRLARLLVDHQPNCRIMATGSASVLHKEKLAESGVGRWITVPIPTLSFYEFIHIRGEHVPEIASDMRLADVLKMKSSEFTDPSSLDPAPLMAFRSYYPKGRNYLLTPSGETSFLKSFGGLEVQICSPSHLMKS